MAEGVSLQLKFETMSGIKTWTFKYAKPSATAQSVKDLMAAMIENGSIYKYPPIRASSAKAITTSEITYDVE